MTTILKAIHNRMSILRRYSKSNKFKKYQNVKWQVLLVPHYTNAGYLAIIKYTCKTEKS